MSAPDTAMVLAAGLGTRMGDLTRTRPKPLLALGQGTLIDHVLDLAATGGVQRAVVNLHYLGGQIQDHLATRTRPRIGFSDESDRILDTGGGVVRALPLLGAGPFFTANSDAVFIGPNPFALLADRWAGRGAGVDALLLVVARERALAYTRPGDFALAADGAAPVRRGQAASAPCVYAGIQIVEPSAFADPPGAAFSTNAVWDRLIAAGRIGAVRYPGTWVDVGTPEGLAAAARALETGPRG